MKTFLTLILIQITAVMYSQNWVTFNKDYRYNYSLETENYTTVVIFADSVLTQGTDTTYCLNRIATKCDSCYIYYPEPGVANSDYVLINQPQFMQRRIIYANNQYRLSDTSNYIIPRFSNTGASWTFNASRGITAQVLSVSLKLNFGISDSIRTILLSTNDTLILSKQFGILKYPAKFGQNTYYKLRGIEHQSSYDVASLYGEKVPNYFDFFKLKPNVIQYYSTTESAGGTQNVCHSYYYAKQTITNSTLTGTVITNSYIEDRKGCLGNCASSLGGYCLISNPYTFPSLPINTYTYSNIVYNHPYWSFFYNSYNNQMIFPLTGLNQYGYIVAFGKTTNNHFLKTYGYSCFSGQLAQLKQNYSRYYYKQSTQNPTVYFTKGFSGNDFGQVGETFIEGYGQVNNYFPWFEGQTYKCTSAIIDGTDTLGSMGTPNIVTLSLNEELLFSSYGPNPTKDVIEIRFPFESVDNTGTVEVKDVFGKLVLQKTISIGANSENINLQNMAQGLYLVEVKMPHFQRLIKVIKE